MRAQQRTPRHVPQEDDDDEEHTLLPAHDDSEDDIDDLMKQLPDDTIRGALHDAGATKLLVPMLIAAYAVWYAGVRHPKYHRPRTPLHHFPPQRQVHHADHQHELRRRWLKATHAVDLTGEGFGYTDAASITNAILEHRRSLSPADVEVFYTEGRSGRRLSEENITCVFGHGHRAPPDGHLRLPRSFYESASFGIALHEGLDNSHDILSERGSMNELEAALKNASMSPQPSRVLPWRALLADSDDDVAEGWVAQYDLADLEKWRAERRGRAASLEAPLRAENAGTVDELWQEAERQIEKIVRRFGLLMYVSWTPHVWGRARPDDVVMDDLTHVHVLQKTVPARSGYQHLRDHAVVWAM